MGTSGATTYVPLNDEVLTEAWERCGLSPSILTGDVAKSARRSMQLMLLDWSNNEIPLWQIERQATTLTAGTAVYATPTGTVDVMELLVTEPTSGNDMMLYAIGRDEYAGIPNKASTGRPTQYWSERTRDAVIIHLWPVPDVAYAAWMNRGRLPQDVGGLAQSPDVPILWSEAVAAGLAARMALKFAPTKYAMLKAEAGEAYGRASGENRERVPLTIQPDMRGFR